MLKIGIDCRALLQTRRETHALEHKDGCKCSYLKCTGSCMFYPGRTRSTCDVAIASNVITCWSQSRQARSVVFLLLRCPNFTIPIPSLPTAPVTPTLISVQPSPLISPSCSVRPVSPTPSGLLDREMNPSPAAFRGGPRLTTLTRLRVLSACSTSVLAPPPCGCWCRDGTSVAAVPTGQVVVEGSQSSRFYWYRVGRP